MQVYKFGGASIANPERMRQLMPVIVSAEKPLVLVVSAYGKTTNALEAVVWDLLAGKKKAAMEKILVLEKAHSDYASTLLSEKGYQALKERLNEYYTELQWALDDVSGKTKDYIYDQIVCMGELLSTVIFSAFLKEQDIANTWMDARDLIRTNADYRDAKVDEASTLKQVWQRLVPEVMKSGIVITQGFIGSNDNNASTTLGREGSDYSAALFAAMLPADSLSIWKDVEGLLNADPKQFSTTKKIEIISFHEVIEMAYYGAQVIHPKTIKPLQNANIPLFVKCFLKPELPGTVISNVAGHIPYPPLIVLKEDQVLLQITSRDFSFITEDNLSRIYTIFYDSQVHINLIQNAAISLVVCVDGREDRVRPLIEALEKDYQVLRNEHLQLLTVRHYSPEIVADLTAGKSVILEQKTRHTIQLVFAAASGII
jgi:aspartate kinase